MDAKHGEFRLRGREVSRMEALSDGVFALAMTLLIVSGQVPESFDGLVDVLKGFPAFAACFGTLLWFWLTHYQFFRRYGLHDGPTVALNSVLLFLILFYAYPLKFVFTAFFASLGAALFGVTMNHGSSVTAAQAPVMFITYSGGFAMVWLVFALMLAHAYRRREALGLDPLERLLTRAEIGGCIAMIGVALISIAFAVFGRGAWISAAGWCYGLLGPVGGVHGWSVGRRRAALEKRLTQSAGQPTGTAHPPRD